MNVMISPRSNKILRALTQGISLSRAEIAEANDETRINTIRALGELISQGYVETSGEARATVYRITDKGRTVVVWDVEEYLRQDPDKRGALYRHIEPQLFGRIRGTIKPLDASVIVGAAKLRRRHEEDPVTAKKELERFIIELSWKSAKIEGNTYTLLDTERLIKESKEAPGHDHSEAVMILNHKIAFDYIWTHQASFRTVSLSSIEEVHRLLMSDLKVPYGLRTSAVGITGTVYIPPASKVEISSYLHTIIDVINNTESPLEKALTCLVLLAYLQPFTDGNKRTSRLMANAVLLAAGYPPLSYRSIDEQAYKGALILFYEQGSVANIRDLYIEQLKDSALSYFFPTKDV